MRNSDSILACELIHSVKAHLNVCAAHRQVDPTTALSPQRSLSRSEFTWRQGGQRRGGRAVQPPWRLPLAAPPGRQAWQATHCPAGGRGTSRNGGRRALPSMALGRPLGRTRDLGWPSDGGAPLCGKMRGAFALVDTSVRSLYGFIASASALRL